MASLDEHGLDPASAGGPRAEECCLDRDSTSGATTEEDGKGGEQQPALGQRRLDSMSWPRCFTSRKQLTVQADLLMLLLCWSGIESTDIRTQEIFSYED